MIDKPYMLLCMVITVALNGVTMLMSLQELEQAFSMFYFGMFCINAASLALISIHSLNNISKDI